jgi:hypothetical protein
MPRTPKLPKPTSSSVFEYVELSGRRVQVADVDRDTRSFLERAAELANDDAIAPERVRAFVFGPDNPILARHPTLPGAYPDAVTIRNPLYWVCVDLLVRAEVRAAKVSLDRAGAPFTTSVSEAARKLGRYPSAVLNAINNRTLHAWAHDGRFYLLPAEIAAYDVPRRGRPPKQTKR